MGAFIRGMFRTKSIKMKTKEILKNAERITISHDYGDGTYLFDVLYDGRAYVIRQYLSNLEDIKVKNH